MHLELLISVQTQQIITMEHIMSEEKKKSLNQVSLDCIVIEANPIYCCGKEWFV